MRRAGCGDDTLCLQVVRKLCDVVGGREGTNAEERNGGGGVGEDTTLENYNNQSDSIPISSTRSLSRG